MYHVIFQINSTSTSKVAQHAIMETPGTESEIYSVITEEPREADTHQPSTVQVPYYVHEQNTTSNELLVVITQNQERIMKKLAEISVQLEEIKENRRPFVSTLGEARGPQKEKFTIEPITKVEELERFNNQLSDIDIFESFLQKYSILCSASRGSGFNCAYRLLDALFSKEFLCKCSWTGGSRGTDVKIGFKGYKNIVRFFFEIVNSWDCNYTVETNEEFLKTVLRNALKRKSTKNIRKSSKKTKKSTKKNNDQEKNTTDKDETQNNNDANPSNVTEENTNNDNQQDDEGANPNIVEEESDQRTQRQIQII